jgi:hypothetical protein
MSARYANTVRFVFKGDVYLAQRFIGEGRKILGQLVNDLAFGNVGAGSWQRVNASGVRFKVTKTLDATPIIEIDVSALKKEAESIDFLEGIVVRPSVHGNFDEFGKNAYTIVNPKGMNKGELWLFDAAQRTDHYTEPFFFSQRQPYANPWLQDTADPSPGAIGLWANHDWRGTDDKWVTYIHGPSNRYSSDRIDDWARYSVYMKGHKVFDRQADIFDTPALEAEPLLSTSRAYVTGACVHSGTSGLSLVIAISQFPVLSTNRGLDWLLAAPLKVRNTSTTPAKISAAHAPEYELDLTQLRIIHTFDWATYYTEHAADMVEAGGMFPTHPVVFNQSGTECCRPRFSTVVGAGSLPTDPAGGWTTELIRDFTDLDDVQASTIRYLHPNTVRTQTLVTDARPGYFIYPRDDTPPADEIGNVGQTFDNIGGASNIINRGSDVKWFRTKEAYTFANTVPVEETAQIFAVDYRDDVRVYARGLQSTTISKTRQLTGDAVYGGQSSVANPSPEFYVDFTFQRVQSDTIVSRPIITDFHTLELTEETSQTSSCTAREENYIVIASDSTHDSASDTVETVDIIYLDLRYQWAVYTYERTEWEMSYVRSWSYGDSTSAPTADQPTTATRKFRVVLAGDIIAEHDIVEEFTLAASTTFFPENRIGFAPGSVTPYTVPGTYTPPPAGRDYSVPANPGITAAKETYVTYTYNFQSPAYAGDFQLFFSFSDPGYYGWPVENVPQFVDDPPQHIFYDRRQTLIAGSWVVQGDYWLFSMAWPQADYYPNYLTMTNFGELKEAIGVEAEDLRFYPISIMPRTARKP